MRGSNQSGMFGKSGDLVSRCLRANLSRRGSFTLEHSRRQIICRPSTQARRIATRPVSRLSYLECRAPPLRDGDEDLARRYDALFAAPDLHTIELDANVIEPKNGS